MDYKFEKCQTESEFWLERGGNVKYLIDVAAGRLLRDLFAQCTEPVLQCRAVYCPIAQQCRVLMDLFAQSSAANQDLQRVSRCLRGYKTLFKTLDFTRMRQIIQILRSVTDSFASERGIMMSRWRRRESIERRQ